MMISISAKRELRKVHALAGALAAETDAQLLQQMQLLRGRDDLQGVRPRVYALVYEAFRRAMGITPYDEQLLGAIAMAQGCIIQMNTGEGKTVTAVFPACLYALSGRGAHIATVNPYLARRDCEWMRPVYALLGISVAVTEAGMSAEEKQAAYACDVTYGTHSEFGFDYLRDQLAQSEQAQVQRAPAFMLVDEADSILLDEAVTPMILSGGGGSLNPLLPVVDRFVGYLRPVTVQSLEEDDEYERLDGQYDYIVLQKERVAILTSLGQKHAEQFFRLKSLDDDLSIAHMIFQAIQAHGTLKRDVDYIVTDGKLQIVDPHTGRVLDGRRYCDGLWQALQVKEKLEVVRESVTVASISYQQYFLRYPLLCGMTGTAREGRAEFGRVYQVPVRVIAPHRRSIRRDLPDSFAPDRETQVSQIVSEVRQAQGRGQPCLIVTRTVEDNDVLAGALRRMGIACEVLSARSSEREAEIIAQAGQTGRVTVATALAGRGTDIRLSDEARAAGGLYVLGFGHQNTRRGDRQLMGRSGRQGDPGMTRFFVSPGDELLVRFLEQDEKVKKRPMTQKACLRAVKSAQRQCEGAACAQRETTLKLDEVIGRFRSEIYGARERVLRGELPQAYAHLPRRMVQAVALHTIDEAWAVFLREADEARQRCGVVSLVGRDYRSEYIREVASMFNVMVEGMQEQMRLRLEKVKGDTLYVDGV